MSRRPELKMVNSGEHAKGVSISEDSGRMLIIGERITANRKIVASAIESHDHVFIREEALQQRAAGAHFIDLNARVFAEEESHHLKWMVQTIQEDSEIVLSLDSGNPKALSGALSIHKGRAILNSVTDEKDRLDVLAPLIREFRPRVIALCMGDDGVPKDSGERFEIANRLIEKLIREGSDPGDIFVDPLVLPMSMDDKSGRSFLDALHRLSKTFPKVNTICGLSNISYGLPARRLVNQIFLVAAITEGLNSVILDPLDRRMMANLRTAEALLGKDEYCSAYLSAFREGKFELEG
jgi:5-methyltetrahydrofolate corrinoid/iron sulfur protein methyltransferase